MDNSMATVKLLFTAALARAAKAGVDDITESNLLFALEDFIEDDSLDSEVVQEETTSYIYSLISKFLTDISFEGISERKVDHILRVISKQVDMKDLLNAAKTANIQDLSRGLGFPGSSQPSKVMEVAQRPGRRAESDQDNGDVSTVSKTGFITIKTHQYFEDLDLADEFLSVLNNSCPTISGEDIAFDYTQANLKFSGKDKSAILDQNLSKGEMLHIARRCAAGGNPVDHFCLMTGLLHDSVDWGVPSDFLLGLVDYCKHQSDDAPETHDNTLSQLVSLCPKLVGLQTFTKGGPEGLQEFAKALADSGGEVEMGPYTLVLIKLLREMRVIKILVGHIVEHNKAFFTTSAMAPYLTYKAFQRLCDGCGQKMIARLGLGAGGGASGDIHSTIDSYAGTVVVGQVIDMFSVLSARKNEKQFMIDFKKNSVVSKLWYDYFPCNPENVMKNQGQALYSYLTAVFTFCWALKNIAKVFPGVDADALNTIVGLYSGYLDGKEDPLSNSQIVRLDANGSRGLISGYLVSDEGSRELEVDTTNFDTLRKKFEYSDDPGAPTPTTEDYRTLNRMAVSLDRNKHGVTQNRSLTKSLFISNLQDAIYTAENVSQASDALGLLLNRDKAAPLKGFREMLGSHQMARNSYTFLKPIFLSRQPCPNQE